MSIPGWIAVALLALLCVGYAAAYVNVSYALWALPRLRDERPAEPERWPPLSVVVTACDEVETIEQALRSLLAQDYPRLELIAVDDRSSDGTGAVIDRVASEDERLRGVHIDALPDGWLGKVHALHHGTQLAGGEWLLYLDADVQLAPGALRRAVGYAIERRLDHLPVNPEMILSTFWLAVAVCSFAFGYFATLRASKIRDPDSDAYAGVGAFNLVRAEALRRSEGWPWLRMEIADDVGLGLMIKRAGGRTGIAFGPGLVSVRWYESVPAMARGLRKNMFAAFGRFSVGYTLIKSSMLLTINAAPLAAVICGAIFFPPLAVFGGGAMAAQAVGAWSLHRRLDAPLLPSLLALPGALLIAYMIFGSMVHTRRLGAVEWRGTRYPIEQLRAGQRVKV